MKKLFLLFTIFFLAACNDSDLPYEIPGYDTPPETAKPEPHRDPGIFEAYVFGIDGADAILLTTENHTVMIDTGDRRHSEHIVRRLAQKNVAHIDYLILTHFNRAHIGGAYQVVRNFSVGEIIVPNYLRDSGHIRRLNEAASYAGVETRILTETLSMTLDGARFTLNPSGLEFFSFIESGEDDSDDEERPGVPNEKNFSIVVSVEHGENSFLFTGGSVSLRLEELLSIPEFARPFDFVKMPNHGRHNRMTEYFVNATRPRFAVTTCDRSRPTEMETLIALYSVGAEIFLSNYGGTLAHCDGTNLTITRLHTGDSWFHSPHTTTGNMEVYFYAIEDADAILIVTSNHIVMKDTGRRSDADRIIRRLNEKNVSHIDYLIISHFHGDHVGGAYRVLAEFTVGEVILPNYDREGGNMRRLYRAMSNVSIEPHLLTRTRTMRLDDVDFVINPSGRPFKFFEGGGDDPEGDAGEDGAIDENDFSIVMSVIHGENSFLFTGDATNWRIREFLTQPDFARNFDVMKLPRHGRYQRRSRELIRTTRPRYAISTCCRANPLGVQKADLLGEFGTEAFLAWQNEVFIRSDGADLYVVQER